MADAQMQFLGNVNGVKWYWAEPGQFANPGVYYWDGTSNVLVIPGDTRHQPNGGAGAEARSAEDRFEDYVQGLIAKAPNTRQLGERLADLLDEDDFNNVNPQLLALARMEASAGAEHARDAARYRWLRAEHGVNSPLAHVSWKRNYERQCGVWVNTESPESLDAAIDAARTTGGEGHE